MTQNKKLNFKIGLLAILTLLVFGIGCVLAYTTNANKVYADYEDLSSDAILNFNQIGSITSVMTSYGTKVNDYQMNFTTAPSTNTYVARTATVFDSTHLYYTRLPSFLRVFNSSASTLLYGGERVQHPVSSGTAYGFFYHSSYGTFITGTYSYVVVDLTLMYGSGNEPSLAQCKEIFTAEYYSYNTGTAVSYSSSSAYSQGYNDAVSNVEVIKSSSDFYSNSYAVSGSIEKAQSLFLSTLYAVYFTDVIAYDLGVQLVAGSTVTIDVAVLSAYLAGSNYNVPDAYFYFGYMNNGNFVSLVADSLTSDMGDISSSFANGEYGQSVGETMNTKWNASYSFTCPTAISTLYMKVVYSNSSMKCSLNDVEVSFTTVNYLASLESSYDSGYDKGYKAGQSYGESVGYERGLDAAENASFQSLFAAIIDAPVNVIASALDFDLLGINLKTFFFSLFTVALVITIIRIFI